jgi:branched-chain amino acid transport system ATP-binding protein
MLKVENLNVFRGPVHAVRDVSFEVGKGEIIGIVGPNGAGKTTLLQSIMGLLPIRSGNIYYNGHNITNLPPHKRARLGIGYVPEDRRLFGEMTVMENILLPTWARKVRVTQEDLKVFEEYFPIVRSLYKKLATQCSGGEQMIVAVLRALSHKPSLLLLDECFEGLAPIARKSLMEYLIREKRERGLSAILTESNPSFVKWVDRVYYIERGSLGKVKE